MTKILAALSVRDRIDLIAKFLIIPALWFMWSMYGEMRDMSYEVRSLVSHMKEILARDYPTALADLRARVKHLEDK